MKSLGGGGGGGGDGDEATDLLEFHKRRAVTVTPAVTIRNRHL